MRWRQSQWEANVVLPAGMYAYQFEIDGRCVLDKAGGSVKVSQADALKGRCSLAIVPNWLTTSVA